MSIGIDITSKCNLDCEFCYMDNSGELRYDNFIKIFGSINKDNVRHYAIGGGEPFLHKEFLNFFEFLSEKSDLISIATNGTIINQDFLNLDKDKRKKTVIQFNLPASNPGLYREITKKDFFNNVINNISLIKNYYNTLINTAVYKKNLDDIPTIIDLSKKLEVPIRINMVFPVGKGKNVEILEKKDAGDLRDFLLSLAVFNKNLISPLLKKNICPLIEEYYGFKKEGPCQSEEERKIYINPEGIISRCEFLR